MIEIAGAAGLAALVGREIGTSAPVTVSQEMIDAFARLTRDEQWIHVDPERAQDGPFGTTIAHGFLTLSLLPALMESVYEVTGFRMAINYGLNRVRFPAPVASGSALRATIVLKESTELEGGVQAVFVATITGPAQDKPSCVAEYVTRYYN